MTVTYGFYDSISSDRLYNAKQMGSIFDGLILDGVYANYADQFVTLEDTGMVVSVGSGRAWFDHTWSYNDAAIGKTIATADPLLDRIDVIYLEINENVGVRANSIGVLTGTPASSPVPPDLTNTSTIHQYALAHVYVAAGVTEIIQTDITDMVGTENTPFVELVTESEALQQQIWAIVGDTNPPLITLITLKAHDHDGTDTVQIDSAGIAAGAVIAAKLASAAVETAKIKDLNVTSGKLATNAVIAGKIASGAISQTSDLVDDVVDDTKVGNRVPILYRRKGGSSSNWDTPGATTYIPNKVMILAGSVQWTGASSPVGEVTVDLPSDFTNQPIAFANAQGAGGNYDAYCAISYLTASQIKIVWHADSNRTSLTIYWIAIGTE